MTTNMDLTLDQDQRVMELLDQLGHLRERLHHSTLPDEGLDDRDGGRKEFLSQVGTASHQLTLSAQAPQEAFWDLIRRCSLISPIRVAQDMGIFRHLQAHGATASHQLADNLGAEECLIVRILRPLCAEGLVVQSEVGVYTLTEHGMVFALPAYEDAAKFAVEFLPVVLSNPTFFQKYGYREPRSHDGFDTPLAAYFKKPGYGFFDYLCDNPKVQNLFISSMHAQVRTQSLLCSVYDYEAQLPPVGNDPSAIAIVDIGGSQGELLLDLRARYPQMKGRMIVLDQKSTLESLLQEPPEGIELMVHDIFTELPIKGAAAYHLKRILHDWSDHSARMILNQVVSAMDPTRSKVLIMDAVLPSTGISLSQAMGDHSMLTFGGKERTEGDWRVLLGSVGLVIEHIYQGPEPEALIECRKS